MKNFILSQNWGKSKGVSPWKIQFRAKIEEKVKELVHEKFQFWAKIEEKVKGLVHEKFKFESKLKKK